MKSVRSAAENLVHAPVSLRVRQVCPHIELIIRRVHGCLHITVADRGPGVPATELATLFQNFVRANNHAEDQYGVGLGLYVVKTTVEAHHGRVGVETRPDGGSRFWFELPLDEE